MTEVGTSQDSLPDARCMWLSKRNVFVSDELQATAQHKQGLKALAIEQQAQAQEHQRSLPRWHRSARGSARTASACDIHRQSEQNAGSPWLRVFMPMHTDHGEPFWDWDALGSHGSLTIPDTRTTLRRG